MDRTNASTFFRRNTYIVLTAVMLCTPIARSRLQRSLSPTRQSHFDFVGIPQHPRNYNVRNTRTDHCAPNLYPITDNHNRRTVHDFPNRRLLRTRSRDRDIRK